MKPTQERARSAEQWYRDYYARTGSDRNDLRANPGVLFQALALEASVVRAARAMEIAPPTAKVLDIGCGGGGDLYHLVRLGFDPANVTGVDILEERLSRARELYPRARFIAADASRLDLPDESFDLVFESTMFATLPDEALSAAIAHEMVRLCKLGGYLLLVDWRTPKPGAPEYRALTKSRLARMFLSTGKAALVGMYRGALVPPVGRFLSRWLPSAYFLVAAVCPPLVGQVAYVLRKTN